MFYVCAGIGRMGWAVIMCKNITTTYF